MSVRTARLVAAAVLIVAFGTVALLAVAQAPATPQEGAVQIKRPNLVVTDLDRALKIYRDILGFKVFAISESSATSYSYPVFGFPKTGKLRMATLNTDEDVRILALTELTGTPLPPKTTPHRSAIVIEVKGIEGITAKLKAAGLHVVPATTSKTPEGATFIEQGFEDYDGHLVVLYEMRQP